MQQENNEEKIGQCYMSQQANNYAQHVSRSVVMKFIHRFNMNFAHTLPHHKLVFPVYLTSSRPEFFCTF